LLSLRGTDDKIVGATRALGSREPDVMGPKAFCGKKVRVL
jgi:hypothetical protein